MSYVVSRLKSNLILIHETLVYFQQKAAFAACAGGNMLHLAAKPRAIVHANHTFRYHWNEQ